MEIRSAQNIPIDYNHDSVSFSSHLSAVSWGAIFAGASAAAALSLILLLLGTGLGLTAVSPWAHEGISGTTFNVTTILWVTITSLIASGIGGYIAGRLRARWAATHADEVYFRDTAHGFLAWAIATLATAALLTSVVSSIISGAAQTGATFASNTVTAATAANVNKVKAETDESLPYFLDFLFRQSASAAGEVAPTAVNPVADNAKPKAEVARIYVNAVANGKLPPADIKYAGQLLAQQIGISQQDAENRITDTFNLVQTKLRDAEIAARNAADAARKATAYGSLWLFISLLAGAFVASFTAIYGGRQRDL
jgi:hypothetical protein